MSVNWNQCAVHLRPPQELLKPFSVPQRTLMGPGPSNCSRRVLNALQQQVLGHLHPEICKVLFIFYLSILYLGSIDILQA